jgi:hypothetical protein
MLALDEPVTALGWPPTVGAEGAIVSTVHEAVDAEPVFPATSVAFTATECGPSLRPEADQGELQAT